jgi:hypothetical protein
VDDHVDRVVAAVREDVAEHGEAFAVLTSARRADGVPRASCAPTTRPRSRARWSRSPALRSVAGSCRPVSTSRRGAAPLRTVSVWRDALVRLELPA